MRLRRGENWFKQIGRFAFQLTRSSDGQWAFDDGKLIGIFHFIPPRRGEAPHDNKMCCSLVIREYSLFIAWFIKARD